MISITRRQHVTCCSRAHRSGEPHRLRRHAVRAVELHELRARSASPAPPAPRTARTTGACATPSSVSARPTALPISRNTSTRPNFSPRSTSGSAAMRRQRDRQRHAGQIRPAPSSRVRRASPAPPPRRATAIASASTQRRPRRAASVADRAMEQRGRHEHQHRRDDHQRRQQRIPDHAAHLPAEGPAGQRDGLALLEGHSIIDRRTGISQR